ncbi:hypothetical protein D3C73_871150 [compost metagenome]
MIDSSSSNTPAGVINPIVSPGYSFFASKVAAPANSAAIALARPAPNTGMANVPKAIDLIKALFSIL